MRMFLVTGALFVSAFLVAQQPIPMGKMDDSGAKYHATDGSLLNKHSSDEQVAGAVRESLSRDPELNNVDVQVKHHKVTLTGFVYTKDSKMRAESLAERTASVRDVRDRVKIGAPKASDPTSVTSAAH